MGDGSCPRILVFTGDGKGKTTAALGMAVRAAGHGMSVLILQFIKADATTGELAAFAMLPTVTIIQTGKGFVPAPHRPEYASHREAAEVGLRQVAEAITSGRYALMVLDEVCTAVERGLLVEASVVEVVKRAPAEMVMVLTGRGATDGLMQLADTVTEMRCIKHGANTGWRAQKGVER
ncbi:MAG TPA: cob(I)alamin adenolsyltransferase [Verrucomicrobia bacterium]|nr:cob(I)alamin adenolsyltransferase [Verrucomicrobiota bacterium]